MIIQQINKPFTVDGRLYMPPTMKLPDVVSAYEYAVSLDRNSYDLDWMVERIDKLLITATYPERLSVIFGYKFILATVMAYKVVDFSYDVYLLGKPITSISGKKKSTEYVKLYPQTRMGAYWSLGDPETIKNYINILE